MQIYAKMLPFVRPYTPEFCHNDSENHPFYVFMNLLLLSLDPLRTDG